MNLDAYDVSKNKSLSFTDSPAERSAAPTTEKAGIFSSFFNKNESAQATAVSSQGASNVAPSEMFNSTAHQTAYQATSVAPVTTYQQAALPATVATPQPVSAPVVSTTVIEKIVTPVAKVNKAKQEEEEEEEDVAPQVAPKIISSAVSSNSDEETKYSAKDFISSARSVSVPQSMATASSRMTAPSFQEASRNPSVIPDESVRSYVEARKFERSLVKGKDTFESHDEGISDPTPPETGLILNAFRTGKIGNKNVTKVALGDDIKDLSTFEKSGTFHGSVVIVEDKAKKERYICRALVNDAVNGAEKLLPVEANAIGKDEMAGYKCTTEATTAPAISPPLAVAEKKAAQKALSGNERLYKAFVLDKIVQGVKKTK